MNKLILWDDLKNKFKLPDSHKKTYSMIVKASKDIPTLCHVNSNSYLKIKWPNGIIISKLKAKNIYSILNYNVDIINHINNIWNTDLDISSWMKVF